MIYWDNNATTRLDEEVLETMLPFLRDCYFNPSASYRGARLVRAALAEARASVAELMGATPEEVFFTSGGTEASNAALSQFSRLVMPAIEHPASLQAATSLCHVSSQGLVDVATLSEFLPTHDALSFALANHELGVVHDMEALAHAAAAASCRVHVDLVQAAGKMPIDLHAAPVDFASLSAHKLHGPKGVGALYVRRGAAFSPLLRGGSQEGSFRAGTENVAGIVGFGKAAQLALAAREDYAQLARLRDAFEQALREANVGLVVHGEGALRLPHVSNLRFEGCKAESLMVLLESSGLICSAGSACSSMSPQASSVLLAIGLSDAQAREALRFSLCRMTSAQEVQQAITCVLDVVHRLKAAQSPLTGGVVVYTP